MRWKNFSDISSDHRHKVYVTGEKDRHEYGVGFLIHKDMVNAILGCRPVSSRLNLIHMRAAPFNVTIIQVYVPTSGQDDNEGLIFYQEFQEIIDQTNKKDILVVRGDWNAKVNRNTMIRNYYNHNSHPTHNTKRERRTHTEFDKRLRKSWEGCTGRFWRYMWTLLQG